MILAIDNWFPFIATQGKFDEAVALVETKIMLEEKFLEPSPDREAHSKLTIAGYRLAQGRLDEASRILEKSQAAIDRLDLQPGNPVRDMEFTWLRGALAGARGDMAENERMYRECILTAEQNAQPTQSMKIALADVIHSQRPFDPETEKLLPIPDISHPNVMSPSNPNAADLHLLYAKLLIDRGKLDEAEPFLKYVSDFVHHKTMPGSYGVGQADSLTGALLAAKGKASDAEPLLLAGLENLRSSRGDHHRLTHEARDRLVNFYRRTGRDEEADQYTEILKVDASLPVAK
jgi:tetratricopeptide (TPR) repeat protein